MHSILRAMAQDARDSLIRWRSPQHRLGPESLLGMIEMVPLVDKDAFVDVLLGLPAMPEDSALPQGAVPYLPCGVDEILKAIRHTPIRESDTFVDLGSGIGRVAMLMNLLVGARAHGLEIQPQLVDIARERAAKLNLDRVTFECRDVREIRADWLHTDRNASESDTSRFVLFLYAPFNGEMLTSALDAIGRFVRGRDAALCAVSMELPELPWLERVPSPSEIVSIFRTR